MQQTPSHPPELGNSFSKHQHLSKPIYRARRAPKHPDRILLSPSCRVSPPIFPPSWWWWWGEHPASQPVFFISRPQEAFRGAPLTPTNPGSLRRAIHPPCFCCTARQKYLCVTLQARRKKQAACAAGCEAAPSPLGGCV